MKAIAQLKKDSLKKDNIIKSLETEQKRREVVLKRKQEEVVTLRKMKLVSQPALSRPPSVSTVGVVMREGNETGKGAFNINRRKSSIFSSESARASWRNMERKVCGMYVHTYVCTIYVCSKCIQYIHMCCIFILTCTYMLCKVDLRVYLHTCIHMYCTYVCT